MYRRLAESVMQSMDDMRPIWDWLAKRIMPRQSDVLNWVSTPASKRKAEHTSAAAEACSTLASSFNTYITPSGQKWCKFVTPDSFASEKHEIWYANATDVTLDELARSKFYAEKYEMDLDRCLFCDGWHNDKLHFRHIPIGTYGIAENIDRDVDTLCRSFQYTAHQAVSRFGTKNLPQDILQAYERPEERLTRKFEFWHLVTPRKEYTLPNGENNVPPRNRKFASVYLYAGGNRPIVEESGYHEFPYLVTRFLNWGNNVWGYPPAYKCFDELNRNIKLDRAQDILTDLQVYPRILQAAEQVGEIDFRAGGRTVVDASLEAPNLPREWLTGGRIESAIERQQNIERRLQAAFYVPCLQVISTIDREMTAAEVHARQEEKIVACSPTYSLYCSDFSTLMTRVFAVLYRVGKYNTSKATQPPELKVPTADGEHFGIRTPKITYHGKINQAINQAEKNSLDYALASIGNYTQLTGDSSCLDIVNTDKLVRYTLDNAGAPAEIYHTSTEVQGIRKKRDEERNAALQLQLAQAANQGSQALRNTK
ncbi:MAG: hypothetical protein IJN29_01600 [Akkermansia sp.]|nr:hypothetical protein [Akkermansia sp.]